MSPVMQARLRRFKENRLGFGCFILFAVIFALSLGAELIANDKPLLVKHGGSLYVPVLKAYPETAFGGVFETEADYKDPAVQQLMKRAGLFGRSSNIPFKPRIWTLLCRCRLPQRSRTGWARMIRAAMCWRAFCTACGCRCCSVSL